MRKIKIIGKLCKEFWQEESGIGTVEIILILVEIFTGI